MKKEILFVAVAIVFALALVLPNLGVMNVDCSSGAPCPEGQICVNHVCQKVVPE